MQTGINGISVYLSRILEKVLPADFPTNAVDTAAILNTAGFIGAVLCIFSTMYFGRKTILVAG
jgi:hypothetical protein